MQDETTYKYDPTSACADEFINHAEIEETLAYAQAHKDDLVDLMCALKRVERGEYLESLNAFSFLSDVMALITDREMLDFLSQPRGTRE